MRAQLLNKWKTLAALATIGLALTVTGWTLASKADSGANSEPVATTPTQTAANQSTAEKKIQDALAKHPKLKGEKIQVESADGGKVKLTGTISKASQRKVAIQVAEKVAGKGKAIDVLGEQCGNSSCPTGTHCCDCLPKNPQSCQCVPNRQPCDDTSKKTK